MGKKLKFLVLMLALSMILVFFSSCEKPNLNLNEDQENVYTNGKDTLPAGFKTSLEEPEDPKEGFWVDFEIYTIDSITPDISYIEVRFSMDESTYTIYLPKTDDDINDATLFKKWIYFPKTFIDEKKEIHFDIARSDGKKALLYGVRPFWWVISSTQKYYDAYYATRKYSSDSKNKFLMRVIVREWEDKRLDREITLAGKIMYEVSPPEGLENLSSHPWISRKTWGFSLQSTSGFGGGNYSHNIESFDYDEETGEFSAKLTGLRYLSKDSEKKIDSFEYLYLSNIGKMCYSGANYWQRVDENNFETYMRDSYYLGEATALVNRFVYFKYEISDDGMFKGDVKSAVANSVGFCVDSLREPSKIIKNWRYIDFDGDSKNDIRFSQYSRPYISKASGSIELYKVSGEVFEDITNYKEAKNNAEEIHWSSSLPMQHDDWNGSLIFILKTTSGKYVKMKIYKIHPLTSEELEEWIEGTGEIPDAPDTTTYASITTSDSTPSDIPEDGAWIHFKVYTIDSITPAGTVLIKITTPNGEATKIALNEEPSEISGISLHTKWVRFDNLSETDWNNTYDIDFINSEGKKALIVGAQDFRTWWRRIYKNSFWCMWDIDSSKKQYEYKELIRHWQDTALPDKEYTFIGNVKDEEGNALDNYKLHLIVGHYSSGNCFSTLSIGEAFNNDTLKTNRIRKIKNEELLPFKDIAGLLSYKDLYSRGDALMQYKDLQDVNNLDLTMYINRIISFKWAISEDGKFNGSESHYDGKINTVREWEFVNRDVAEDFRKSFNDPHLTHLTEYDFDGDGIRDMYVYSNENSTGYYMRFNSSNGITDLGEEDISVAIDLTKYSFSCCEEIKDNHLYGLKTSSGKYVLFKVTDIHKMSQDEISEYESEGNGDSTYKEINEVFYVSEDGKMMRMLNYEF